MSNIPFYDIPDKIEHVIQLCQSHPCQVVEVGDKNCCGDVKVTFPGSEESSIWMSDVSLACGDNKRKNPTGLFAPAQPGQAGYFICMGSYRKLGFVKGGVYMPDKGVAG